MNEMKYVIPITVVIVAGLMCSVVSASPPGASVMTDQGRLDEAGEPAAGPIDLGFMLYDAATNGMPIGGAR